MVPPQPAPAAVASNRRRRGLLVGVVAAGVLVAAALTGVGIAVGRAALGGDAGDASASTASTAPSTGPATPSRTPTTRSATPTASATPAGAAPRSAPVRSLTLPAATPLLGGDVDGDSQPDLVLTGRDADGIPQAVVLHGTDDGGLAAPEVWADELAHAPASGPIIAGMGDMNGDGRADLVEFDQGSHGFEVWVQLSTGHGFAAATRWGEVPTWILANAKVMIDDFDGDGKDDVAEVGKPPGGGIDVQVLLSTGTGLQDPRPWYTGPGDWARINRTSGDYDGDGRADVVLVTTGGRLTLLHSTGDSFEAEDGGYLGITPTVLPKAFNAGASGAGDVLGFVATTASGVEVGASTWTGAGFSAPSWTPGTGGDETATLPRAFGEDVAFLVAGSSGSTVQPMRAEDRRLVAAGPTVRLPWLHLAR